MNNGTCRYCGAKLLWIRTKLGRNMPCDPDEKRFVPGEGSERLVTPDGDVVTGRIDAGGSAAGYIAHWATCPHAGRARKSERKRRA